MGSTNTPRGTGPASLAGGGAALPVVALVAALLVGPVGIALGAWALSQRHIDKRGRTLAMAAVALGVVQTVVVGSLALAGVFGRPSDQTPAPTGTAWTYPTTAPPSEPAPDPSVSQTPIQPAATTLEEFIPESVDSYGWEAGGEDSDALGAGATSAEQGTFINDGEEIRAGMAEWASSDEARADALARAERDFPGTDAIGDGQLQYGAGHWWYYERDGVGTIYWYLGTFSAQFTGEPHDVQEFLLRFPK